MAIYEKVEDADSVNDIKIKRIKEVEQEDFFTLNEISQQIVDLGIRRKTLQEDLVKLDEEITELEAVKKEVEKIAVKAK